MRSLFFKIFLWFWLAMALLAAALLAVTWTMRADPVVPAQHAFLGDALEQNAKIALWRLKNRGKADVAAYLQRMEKKNQVCALLMDARGDVIVGNSRVIGAKALAQAAAKRDEVEFQISGVDLMAARRVVDTDGRVYVLLASMPRAILAALRVQPGTRLLRITATMIIAGLVCFGLARYLADPVVKLRAATRRFAAGDLTVRVRPQLGHRRDELADLAHDFDVMAAQIATLLMAQRRLLGDVSHELRTPLTRLNLALELARRHAGDNATPALDRIEREAAQLNELIGQLLMLSRLESGEVQPAYVSFDLAEMLSEIVADAKFEAESTQRHIQLQKVESCRIHGTPAVVRSTLENVIRNSLRHTPEQSSVDIKMLCETKSATITVRDYGPGVPPEALTEIFLPFYRVDESRDRQDGGAGLGLAIVERGIVSHGGTVEAQNAPDGGLIIQICLPLKEKTDTF